jgi:histidine ammonia-lyase
MTDAKTISSQEPLVLGLEALTLDDLVSVALDGRRVRIDNGAELNARLERSQARLGAALERGVPIYGVTTGYGGSCGSRFRADSAKALGENLIRYHGCGNGEPLGVSEVRGAMLCRLVSLLKGYSGVSRGLLEQLVSFLNEGITPIVPSRGSVGASGDLTPLSYVAAALSGEREVLYQGLRQPTCQALEAAGISPHRFLPKEPLAVINGTAIMTGVAVVAVERSRRILDAAVAGSALAVHGMAGNADHFRPEIFAAKPFAGQARIAASLAAFLEAEGAPPRADTPDALQDPYSLRCACHVLGVLEDALTWITEWVEIEANSVSDNPLLHPETDEVLTGGNFYGGHITFAMDGLKAALASLADLADRQIALLVDPRFSRGLPSCLSGMNDGDEALHHGFKALQITASALTAEAQKNTMPAAVFSRSTESHNQDKVSLGTIAARDAEGVADLAAGVVASQLLAAAQACELRGDLETRPRVQGLVNAVRSRVPAVLEDRPMDQDIEEIARMILDDDGFGEAHERLSHP